MNSHFAGMEGGSSPSDYQHGLQIIDENQNFNQNLARYLSLENVGAAGFNYHLISVFGSQSTGKSTLLNTLFDTNFGVMSEAERRQTTKGIWMSKNKNTKSEIMAENVLVMDVEGTDGRERGEDQDFERKSALFALATSEVLIVNIWEHQVGLYQGANMGLLKVVFEVNLELFLKDKDRSSSPRSLLFFVIRDFLGNTPLANLRNTLTQDLNRIWSGLNKPAGLENSKISDYFDFAFAALPHKILQPERFLSEVKRLGTRFREGQNNSRKQEILGDQDDTGIFLPEYHRRIPADGLSHYAEGVWDQIVNNKDLDLPTQQELLAQFRCDEIMREVLVGFDEAVVPMEEKQSNDTAAGNSQIIPNLGDIIRAARSKVLLAFQHDAGRYHKAVFVRKNAELVDKVDSRLKIVFQSQLLAAHKVGIARYSDAVISSVKEGQKKGASYDFGSIVDGLKQKTIQEFKATANSMTVEGVSWSDPSPELKLFQKDLDAVTTQLRKDEMRRLATRSERWVRARLGDSVGLHFNALGSGRAGSGAPEKGDQPSEQDVWDRIWATLLKTVSEAEDKFAERAKTFDATPEEVEVGLWRLRRKSWKALRDKIDEEMLDGNLLLKLRENFEDKFRYDEHGVPRIWRPTDDIEGIYTRARESTLMLIPILSRFQLQKTSAPPPLDDWVGKMPLSATAADEEDLVPIGGVDDDEGKSFEEEMIILNDTKRQDITVRFKKTADGVYVEAKRSAIGSMTQIPLYFYGLLLALGWNEIVAVLRNPVYFLFLILLGIGAYVTYTLNLWGPMIKMVNAASQQAVEEGKRRLREFLEATDTGQQAIHLSSVSAKSSRINGGNTVVSAKEDETDDDGNDI